jgi:hypothetical protein
MESRGNIRVALRCASFGIAVSRAKFVGFNLERALRNTQQCLTTGSQFHWERA